MHHRHAASLTDEYRVFWNRSNVASSPDLAPKEGIGHKLRSRVLFWLPIGVWGAGLSVGGGNRARNCGD